MRKKVAIVGAGPVGLAAAAHVLERGMEPVLLEAGSTPGAAVRAWSHVRMFSPWKYNVDHAAERLLASHGWNRPDPEAYPTGGELVERYLEPLAMRTPIASHLHLNARVTSIARKGFDKVKSAGRELAPFEIRHENGKGPSHLLADAVIDASGTWASPNPAGANGLTAIGEENSASSIAYGMPDVLNTDRTRFANKAVVVIGSGHSAIGTMLDLVRLKAKHPATEITWVLRGTKPEKAFGGGASDQLAERGSLGTQFARHIQNGLIRVEAGFQTSHVQRAGEKLRISGGSARCGRHVFGDEVIVSTGFRPDLDFLRELRASLDPALECTPALAPLIDPNEHSCGTVRPHGARELSHPEKDFYIAGMKSYGRAPTFLVMTGHEQVRSIVAAIAGDMEAAGRVELVLPETGVCNGAPVGDITQTGCCPPSPSPAKSGCCE